MATTHALSTVGTKEDDIPVRISYRIINLFSEGLYSSPNKALEELVANSYDALATNVHVIIPTNTEDPGALIWVIDDGISMDSDGLFDLWRIASSTKRDPGNESPQRPPIGKFGIGKLATYVLARQLTYVCKRDGTYRAVTMDFTKIDQSADYEQQLVLPLRSLTEDEAKALLAEIVHRTDKAAAALPLFGPAAPEAWTVAVMGHLTALAQRLTSGRLKWVLCTALPLSPEFSLFFNGERLKSTKERRKPLETWAVGRDDKVAEKLSIEPTVTQEGLPAVNIDGVGTVWGTSEIYADPLTGGKAAEWGRSHGFFVMVRNRLLNLDDALFGLNQLSHGPFARFRMVVHADGLDGVIRAAREGVLVDSQAVKGFQKYIEAKFNEARNFYANWLQTQEHDESLSTRIAATPQSLSRRPLLNAIRRVLDGSISELFLTHVPRDLDNAGKEELLNRLRASLESAEGLIKDVRFEPLPLESPLAVFDAATGCVRVNLMHPFYMNYYDHYKSNEPFELIAVADILTETYLHEADLSPAAVRRVLRRRDMFLRELVFGRSLSAPLAADHLRNSVADPSQLEFAVCAGLRNLGFEVTPIGGNGKPDGIALARLGIRDPSGVERADYKFTYDAKSTGNERVKAKTVGAATIARHRDSYQAHYALVVAPAFEGGNEPGSAVAVEARAERLTLLTVEDLARLVLVAATRQLGFTRLQDLFGSCRGPADSKAWVDALVAENPPAGPIRDILDAIWKMMEENPEPVTFSAVVERLRLSNPSFKSMRGEEVRDWMQSLARLAGEYIEIQAEVVYLNAPPDRVLRELRLLSNALPEQLRQQAMIATLLSNDESPEESALSE